MKKHVVFVLNALPCGGVERSFLSYLSLFDPAQFEITVLLLKKQGEWLSELPAWVKVEELRLLPADSRDVALGRTGMVLAALRRLDLPRLALFAFRLLKPRAWSKFGIGSMNSFIMDAVRAAKNLYPKNFKFEYDLVVAYGCYHHSAAVTQALFKGRQTAVWFHSEDQFRTEGKSFYRWLYQRFDHRFCASQTLAEAHNRDYCDGRKCFEHFPHYLNVPWYQKSAMEGVGFDDGYRGVRILTVGRLSMVQKGADIAIAAAKLLRAADKDFRWYWVGGAATAEEEKPCREMIRENELEHAFVLLGTQNNPYPYYRQCDIYVQPSRFEGYCLTVAEARAFAKPIVATDFSGAREQLKDGLTGTIVKTVTPEAIARAVANLIDRHEVRERYSAALGSEVAGNKQLVREKWEELFK